METYMTPERQDYISRLKTQIDVIDHILRMDSGTVVSTEIRKQLRILKNEAESVLKKLENNEFEIAIVGLEKAGKSTFANALIENDLLPRRDTRCTFTSTQIEYSGDDQGDSATVSFYTNEEFDKDFKDKLFTIGIPNHERYSYDTISEQTYLSLYESDVSEEKKKLYSDSIHADILSIIRNIGSLSNLLGRPIIQFSADKINSGELAMYITDESKARAVKQVVIRSKKLNEMKNAVIFDVPGFNSPTEMHKIQTLERMRSADAIIVVANGVSPSLTGESLKILRESDDEGNPLNDKLFVFANKIEGATDIAKNINDTYAEWTSKGFISATKKHRVIFGSALAHLQAAGIDSDDRTLRYFRERENQMIHGDGIDAMRQELEKYNQNERFEVLKRRINRIKADINKTFSDIRTSSENYSASRSYSTEQVATIIAFINGVLPDAEDKLNTLKKDIQYELRAAKPLSIKILEYIADNITPEQYGISDELLEREKKAVIAMCNFEDVDRIEGEIRKLKFVEMYNDFCQNVINIADHHHADFSSQIIDILLTSLGVTKESPYYDDLKDMLTNEVSGFRSDMLPSVHKESNYQSLIERFSRDIYEVLILSQYSTERLREFYGNIDNYYSLSIFYKKPECEGDLSYINKAPKDQPLCMMLLFHSYLNATDSLRNLFNDICRITGINELPDDIKNKAEKVFAAVGGDIATIIKNVTDGFSKVASGMSYDFRIQLLNRIIGELIDINEPCSIADEAAFTSYYKKYHSSLRGDKLKSLEDFRNEFNVDIQILQDVLTNAFVRAIYLEKPFMARETKSIDDIIGYIKSDDFSRFLSDNYFKIKYREIQIFDKQRREQEQNAAIIGEINGILDKLAE